MQNRKQESPETPKPDKNRIISDVIKALRTIYDPEIPLNIYDLGLIYELTVDDSSKVHIKMTLTAPGCPMSDYLFEQVNEAVTGTPGVSDCALEVVFEPEWDKSRITEEGLVELGML